MAKTARSRDYEIRTTFRAPLSYVFRWCTDYGVGDAQLEKDEYERRIVRRTRREVVFEDLYDAGGGWGWSRMAVHLRPPTHWHGDAVGNMRLWSLDYDLRDLGGGRTELRLRGRRTSTALGGPNPSKARLERELRASWSNFAKALESDYRRSRRKPA